MERTWIVFIFLIVAIALIVSQQLLPKRIDQEYIKETGETCAVCIYGAIARGYPAAWESQLRHIIMPLRESGLQITVHIWEQVDSCYDGLTSPTDCRSVIEPHVDSYLSFESQDIDAIVLAYCRAHRCADLTAQTTNWKFPYRYAYMENKISDFLNGRAGYAVAISGDFVFAKDLDIAEILRLENNEVGVAPSVFNVPDGFYAGKAQAVSAITGLYKYRESLEDNIYEHNLQKVLDGNGLSAREIPTVHRKMRRSGNYDNLTGDHSLDCSPAFNELQSRMQSTPRVCHTTEHRNTYVKPDIL